jgi:hypothetical protein
VACNVHGAVNVDVNVNLNVDIDDRVDARVDVDDRGGGPRGKRAVGWIAVAMPRQRGRERPLVS